MKQKKQKPAYRRIRIPLPVKTGGAHTPDKGGKYLRNREKDKIRQDIKAELDP